MNTLILFLSFLLSVSSFPSGELKEKRLEVQRLPDMNTPRSGHNAFCVNGEVVVAGGHTSGFLPTPTAEYFADGEWHQLQMVYSHDQGIFCKQSSGEVLLIGGHEKHLGIGQTFVIERYMPATHSFQGFGCLEKKRVFSTALELDSGKVYIAGNWYTDDCIEFLPAGQTQSLYAKPVTRALARPYIYRIASDDLIVFGPVDEHGKPVDNIAVDRLRGEPLNVPLFRDWRPFDCQCVHDNEDSFIGDAAAGDYSYLLSVVDKKGNMAVVLVRNGEFSLLPTSTPIPMQGKYGKIHYFTTWIADRQRQRAYLVGHDDDRRLYVVTLDLSTLRQPASTITLQVSAPQDSIGLYMPVLTPEGHLLMAGGTIDSNFSPTATAVLLCVGSKSDSSSYFLNLPSLLGEGSGVRLLTIGGFFLLLLMAWWGFRFRKSRSQEDKESRSQGDKEFKEEDAEEVYQQLCQLMESEKLYLNSELKLGDVAERLGFPARQVTNSIRPHHDGTFSSWVNGYRVSKAQQILRDHPDKKLSLVATESGFSNETSFFRTFKTFTGFTPREWIAQG